MQNDYAKIIRNAAKSAFEYGKNDAAKEIGVSAPANPAEMLRQIDIQADAIANHQIAEIEADSKNAYVQALNKGESLAVALGAADAAAAEAIDALTSDAAAILISGYINHGRDVVCLIATAGLYTACSVQKSSTRPPATTALSIRRPHH